ncbi:endonuclease domain-containing protein [Streptomyces sp. NPDC059378]|uniref:endonuclease domain-containing protein n=1 Tax=Streptomyces sp. NPDC059378 TaxID=3346815 RepID=UPI00368F5304
MPRPWAGLLPLQWPDEKIPRRYAWWRLHDIQDGTCATCDAAAYAIDHDHNTGLVRGPLTELTREFLQVRHSPLASRDASR